MDMQENTIVEFYSSNHIFAYSNTSL